MLIRRLARGVRGQDWFPVMVGLVAAFQVDRWWEVRGLQIDQITAHAGRLKNARALLDNLNDYAARINE